MIDTYARKYAQPVIRRTARSFLNMGLSANQVTWTAFVIGVASSVVLYLERPLFAVIVLSKDT